MRKFLIWKFSYIYSYSNAKIHVHIHITKKTHAPKENSQYKKYLTNPESLQLLYVLFPWMILIEVKPAQKYRLVVHSVLPLECRKSKGFRALLSWAESRATYMSLQQIFLVVKSVQKTKKKVNQKCKSKKENNLPSLPGNGAKILIEIEPAHKIQNFKTLK